MVAITDPGFSPFRWRTLTQYSAPPCSCCKQSIDTGGQMAGLYGHSFLLPSSTSISRPYGTWNACPLIGLTVCQSRPQSTIASWASIAYHWSLGVRSRASHEINPRWTPFQGCPLDALGKRFSHANPAPVQPTRGARHIRVVVGKGFPSVAACRPFILEALITAAPPCHGHIYVPSFSVCILPCDIIAQGLDRHMLQFSLVLASFLSSCPVR